MLKIRGYDFQFDSVFIIKKKLNRIVFFFKTKIGLNRPVSVRFFRTKPVQTGLAWFFPVWQCFFYLARVFSVWVQFRSVFSISSL